MISPRQNVLAALLATMVAFLSVASPALAERETVQAAGTESTLQFDAAALQALQGNEENVACFTSAGTTYFANWLSSLALPLPFDFPPDLAAWGLNLALKYCPPKVEVPETLIVNPAGQCSVDLAVNADATPSMEYIFWVPTSSTTRWGDLGEVTATHMNSEVEVSLRRHTGQASASAINFPIGRHELVWRGNTMISILDKAYIYVPSFPAGTRWKKALSLLFDLLVEAGLIAADVSVDGDRHQVFHDETQKLSVLDLVPPSLSLSQTSITLEANAFGGATRFFYQSNIDALITASDNCNRPVSLTFSDDYFPVNQTTPLTITVFDEGPNLADGRNLNSQVLQVEVVDTVPPQLLVPDNEVVEANGPASIVLGIADVFDFVDDQPTVSNDALSLPGVSEDGGKLQFPQGVSTITWTARDFSGNETTATQTINVKTPGSNNAPLAQSQSVNTLTEEITEIIIRGSDVDNDPLNFHITANPEHGSLVSELLPFFVEDYRQPVDAAPPGEAFRCQPGRPDNKLAWPHAMSVTEEGFIYILDVGSELPVPNGQFTDCESFLFNVWPSHRLHKLTPDGEVLNSIDLPAIGGHFFGGTLSIDEERGTLLYATDVNFSDDQFLLIDLDDLTILESFPMPDYNGGWKGILTADDILIWITGLDEVIFHDLREQRVISNENELARITPFEAGEFNTDIVMDSEGNLYVKSEFPVHKYAPYTIDADGTFTPGELIGWMGPCTAGPGCDVANGRSRGFSCTNDTCDYEFLPFGTDIDIPGRSFGPALALDPLDNLYIGGANIQRYTNTGLFAGIAYPNCPTEQRCFVQGDFGGAFSLFVNDLRLYTIDPDFELVHVFQTSVISPIDDNSASIRYLSAWGFDGPDSIEFVTSDGLSDSPAATISLNVNRQFRAPVAYKDRSQDIGEDTPTSLRLDGYDPDGPIDSLTFDIPGQPMFGSVEQQGDEWIYLPDEDFFGADQLMFRVFDGREYSQPELFRINVLPSNDPTLIDLNDIPRAGRGFEVQTSGVFTDADPVDLHTINVDWGDGIAEEEGVINDDGTLSGPVLFEADGSQGNFIASHIYNDAGIYSAAFCITDNMVSIGGDKQPSATSLESCRFEFVEVILMANLAPASDLYDPINPSATIVYTIEAENRAPDSGPSLTATAVELTHELTNVTITEVEPIGGSHATGNCSFSGQTASCSAPAVLPGQAFKAQITATLNPGLVLGNQLSFSLEVSANEPDASVDNTLNRTITLVPEADFLVTEANDFPDAVIDGVCATSQTGLCSLRAALQESSSTNDPLTIQLSAGNFVLGEKNGDQRVSLNASGNTIIRGMGPGRTRIYGGPGQPILRASGGMLELRDLTIEGAEEQGALQADFSSITIDNVLFENNQSNFSVLGFVLSEVDISNSTFVNNRAEGTFGSILVNDGSTLNLSNVSMTDNSTEGAVVQLNVVDFESASGQLTHVTIAENSAQNLITIKGGNLELSNSLLGATMAGSAIICTEGDLGLGVASSLGGNILTTDNGCLTPLSTDRATSQPGLGPLLSYPGGLLARMPLVNSPAIGQALQSACLERDAIGRTRPFNGDRDGVPECEAGALEFINAWLFNDSFEGSGP